MSHSLLYIIGNTEHHGTHSQGATSLGCRLPLAGSVFYAESSDGSKQYSNNTKTVVAATVRRGAVAAIRRATIGRVVVPTTAADHAVGAGGRTLWVVSTG